MSEKHSGASSAPTRGRYSRTMVRTALVIGALVTVAGVGLIGWRLTAGPASAVAGEPGPQVTGDAPVTATNLQARRSVTSPVVARDPTTPDLVAAASRRDAPGPGCGLELSGDGGASWWPVKVLGQLPDEVGACYAPQTGFDGQGRLVFSFVGMQGPPPEPAGLWMVTSDDHAQSFSVPRKAAEVNTVATSLAVSEEGDVHTAWLQPAGGESGEAQGWPVGSRVLAAAGQVGDDFQATKVPVSVEVDGLVAAPTVVVGPDGGALVAYYRLPADASLDKGAESLVGSGSWQLMVARRPADAARFDEPETVAETRLPPASQRYPHLVSSRGIAPPGLAVGGERACVAWTSRRDTTLDAWVGCSDDGGRRWGEPSQLGTGLAADTFQWLPQVAITDSERVAATFYHQRESADLEQGVDAYYTATTDPSTGFSKAVRVSSRSHHPRQGPVGNWFGTRMGLTASDTHGAVAMWADGRNGLPPSHPSQTLVAATVAAPPGEAGPSGGFALGGGLAIGGLGLIGAAAVGRRRMWRQPHNHMRDEAPSGERGSGDRP